MVRGGLLPGGLGGVSAPKGCLLLGGCLLPGCVPGPGGGCLFPEG